MLVRPLSTRKRTLTFGMLAVSSALMFGCAVSHDDGTDSSGADITGSLAQAKACAVRSAYEGAGLEAFTHLEFDQLPSSITSHLERGGAGSAYAKFVVPGVGTVYVVDLDIGSRMVLFYDASGMSLTWADVSDDTNMSWQLPTGGSFADASSIGRPLVCSSPAPQADASAASDASFPEPTDASFPEPTDASRPEPEPSCSFCGPSDAGTD